MKNPRIGVIRTPVSNSQRNKTKLSGVDDIGTLLDIHGTKHFNDKKFKLWLVEDTS